MMRFSSAYLTAFSIVQAGHVAFSRQVDITGWGMGKLLAYNLETVFCAPMACDGIQPYEWIALPLAVLATVVFLAAPVVAR